MRPFSCQVTRNAPVPPAPFGRFGEYTTHGNCEYEPPPLIGNTASRLPAASVKAPTNGDVVFEGAPTTRYTPWTGSQALALPCTQFEYSSGLAVITDSCARAGAADSRIRPMRRVTIRLGAPDRRQRAVWFVIMVDD